MNSASELREMNDDSLLQELAEAKQGLYNLRFRNATGQLDNPAEIPVVRRHVARINTELRAREIAAADAMAGQE